MLKLLIGATDGWNEATQTFGPLGGTEIQLEHSLVSLSKWESSWEKPFLETKDKTNEEVLDYVQCMSVGDPISVDVLKQFTQEDFDAVSTYINAKMSATWFSNRDDRPKSITREIITAEVMYYWMVALTIPFECQYWHLNRLITLVDVCNEKNKPAKKQNMPLKVDQVAARRAENERRKAQAQTRG